jgi:hypothetical protein
MKLGTTRLLLVCAVFLAAAFAWQEGTAGGGRGTHAGRLDRALQQRNALSIAAASAADDIVKDAAEKTSTTDYELIPLSLRLSRARSEPFGSWMKSRKRDAVEPVQLMRAQLQACNMLNDTFTFEAWQRQG